MVDAAALKAAAPAGACGFESRSGHCLVDRGFAGIASGAYPETKTGMRRARPATGNRPERAATKEEKLEKERPNKGWVRLLTVLVGFLTVLAILSAWVDSQIFDTQEWGDTSLKMLQNPEIQKQVATYAVDELYANVDVEAELSSILPSDLKPLSGVAAGALRSVADQGAQKALENQRIQNAWRQANESAHQTLVAIIEDKSTVVSTTGGKVELQLRPLIIEVADQVGLGDQARKNIPDNVGQVEIIESKQLAEVQTVAKLIRGTALISALVLLLLLGLAVYLSKGYRWLTLLWLSVALIIGSLIVLLLRSVAGGVLVPELATVDVLPAANAAYAIATELLQSMAWTVIWSALFLVPLAWLLSPTGPAEKTREFLAVPFGRYPGASFGLLGLLAFVFLLMGATDQREFLIRLMIVVLLGLGTFFFRRSLMVAYPDADFERLTAFGRRTQAKAGDLWSKRPKSLPKRKSKAQATQAPESPAAPAASAAGDPSAETAVMATSADPGKARLDQLERLADMHGRGILTDEEFASEKRRVMGEGD